MKTAAKKGAETAPEVGGWRVPEWPARRRDLAIGLGLCVLALIVYSNSFSGGFVMDNRGLILEDSRVHAATAENVGLIFKHTYWWPYGESGLYRPLTTLSYLFNYAVLGNGEQPEGYHWLNFLLHAGNVLLVYALGRRLAGWRAGAWTAAIWAVHPVLTESVTNIVGRADLMAAMALLGGLLLYLKSTEAAGWRRWLYLCALGAATAAGAFSKESAVTVVGVVALYEAVWWKERRQAAGLVLGLVAMLIPVQAMLYQRAAVLWASAPTLFPFCDNPIVAAGWAEGRLTALRVMGKYAGLLLWPASLSCDYSWGQIRLAEGSAADWAGWLILAGVAAAGVLLWRRSRMALFLAGSAVLVFLPTSNLLFAMGTIMAERFFYLPAIAFAAGLVVAAAAAEKRWGNSRVWMAALALVVAACGARTWARNADWQDEVSISKAAVAASPESHKSHLMLANALFEGHSARVDIDRVLAEAERSLAILEPLPPERSNSGAFRRTAGWYLAKADLEPENGTERVRACRRALELLQRCRGIVAVQPATARARMATIAEIDRLMAAAHLKLGETGQAIEVSAGAIDGDPDNPELYRQYAQALETAGKRQEAIAVLMQGVMLTMNAGLRQNVVQAYQQGVEGGGCALMRGQNGSMALNPRCEVVKEALCVGTAAAMRVRAKAGLPNVVEDLRKTGIRDFGCTPAALGGQ